MKKKTGTEIPAIRVFAENLVGLGFLSSVSYIKAIPTDKKKKSFVRRSGPNATFNLFFLGLGWPWVVGSSSVS